MVLFVFVLCEERFSTNTNTDRAIGIGVCHVPGTALHVQQIACIRKISKVSRAELTAFGGADWLASRFLEI